MPRRMINPEIWFNEKIAKLSDPGRLLFIGIFSNADNEGRLKASPKYLKAHVFPYDDDKTVEDIQQLRDQCAELGLIRLYGKNGQEYLDLPGWYEHQSIRKDRYRSSELPPFEEADHHIQPSSNQAPTKLQPPSNQAPTTVQPLVGLNKGKGGEKNINEYNTPQSKIEGTSSPASDVTTDKDTKDTQPQTPDSSADVKTSYQDWYSSVKETKNKPAALVTMLQAMRPEWDPNTDNEGENVYSRMGKILKQDFDGDWGFMTSKIWDTATKTIHGNLLNYLKKSAPKAREPPDRSTKRRFKGDDLY